MNNTFVILLSEDHLCWSVYVNGELTLFDSDDLSEISESLRIASQKLDRGFESHVFTIPDEMFDYSWPSKLTRKEVETFESF